MGFSGHLLAGHFDRLIAVPLAFGALLGGLIGGRISIQVSPDKLKRIFGITTAIAGLLMVYKILR